MSYTARQAVTSGPTVRLDFGQGWPVIDVAEMQRLYRIPHTTPPPMFIAELQSAALELINTLTDWQQSWQAADQWPPFLKPTQSEVDEDTQQIALNDPKTRAYTLFQRAVGTRAMAALVFNWISASRRDTAEQQHRDSQESTDEWRAQSQIAVRMLRAILPESSDSCPSRLAIKTATTHIRATRI